MVRQHWMSQGAAAIEHAVSFRRQGISNDVSDGRGDPDRFQPIILPFGFRAGVSPPVIVKAVGAHVAGCLFFFPA